MVCHSSRYISLRPDRQTDEWIDFLITHYFISDTKGSDNTFYGQLIKQHVEVVSDSFLSIQRVKIKPCRDRLTAENAARARTGEETEVQLKFRRNKNARLRMHLPHHILDSNIS